MGIFCQNTGYTYCFWYKCYCKLMIISYLCREIKVKI